MKFLINSIKKDSFLLMNSFCFHLNNVEKWKQNVLALNTLEKLIIVFIMEEESLNKKKQFLTIETNSVGNVLKEYDFYLHNKN